MAVRGYYITAGIVVALLIAGVAIEQAGTDLRLVALSLTWGAFFVCAAITFTYALLLRFYKTAFGRQTFAGYIVFTALIGASLLRQLSLPERDAVTSVIMGLVILLGAMREAMILRKGPRPDGRT